MIIKKMRLALTGRRQGHLREILLFVIVGIVNTALDFATLNLLIILTHHDRGIWLIGFTCCGFLAAVINSYILNGCLTFRGQGSRVPHRFLRFVVVNAVGLIINSCIVWVLVQIAGNRYPPLVTINASKALAVVCSMTWNYIATTRWVFNAQSTRKGQGESLAVALNATEPGADLSFTPLFENRKKQKEMGDGRRAAFNRVVLLPLNSTASSALRPVSDE